MRRHSQLFIIVILLLLSGCSSINKSVENNNYAEVQGALNNGAQVDAANTADETPLILASFYGNHEIAKLLVERGANINLFNKEGSTPLSYAARCTFCDAFGGDKARSPDDYLKIVDLLISHGADLNAQTFALGNTPLMVTSNLKVAEHLIAAGADLEIKNNKGQTAYDLHLQQGDKKICELISTSSKSNFAAPDKITPPSPIAGNSGKYMSPYTSSGALALWAQPQITTDNGSDLAGNIGSTVGKKLADKTLEFVPFGLGGMIGQNAGEAAARSLTRKAGYSILPEPDLIKASSDISFNKAEDLAVYLYAKHSNYPQYKTVLALVKRIYPELQQAYKPAIEAASKLTPISEPSPLTLNNKSVRHTKGR